METHFSDGTPRPKDAQLSKEELIALDMYWCRPAEELIFLATKEHYCLHKKGKHWYNNGEKQTMAYDCPESFVPGRLI